jgi:hypothetical protein
MRVSGNCYHDLISEITSQTAEDGVVGEEDSLILALLVSNLYAQQQSLEMAIQALVIFHLFLCFCLYFSISLCRVLIFRNIFSDEVRNF